MKFTLSLIFLSPILIIQALYTRLVTTRLPEAKGPRSGDTKTVGSPLRLLVVGDSAAAGVGVEKQSQALCGQIALYLSADVNLNWRLIAKTGISSGQMVGILREQPAEKFESVVVSLGVNDILECRTGKQWRNDLLTLMQILKQDFSAKQIILTAIPPLHLFPALPQPLRWSLGERAKTFNRILKSVSELDAGLFYLELSFSEIEFFMAEDGFHPGEKGYQRWGKSIAELISKNLIQQKSPNDSGLSNLT